jgi:hypothetical protein
VHVAQSLVFCVVFCRYNVIFCPFSFLYCLSFRLLITPLIYVGHYIVCPLNYGFWLPLWYLLTIVLSVLWITASGFPFDICWPLYCLSFELRLLVTPLISVDHCIVCPLNYGFWLPLWYLLTIALSVLWITASGYPFDICWPLYCLVLWIMAFDYPFDICWPLYCLSFELRLLITPFISVGHCIVCP